MLKPMFGSIFLAGYECAAHVRGDGVRLDLMSCTQHDQFCERDYVQAQRHNLKGARDGLRWHLIEARRGHYDWSSVLPMVQAARRQDVNVIWDLCHYGVPDWLDIWSADFPNLFADYAERAVSFIQEVSGKRAMICPMNEISFWSWLGGHEGKIYPFSMERAGDLKRQLVRAKIAAIKRIKAVNPETLTICAEPLIQVVRDTNDACDVSAAAEYHNAQYEALDLALGYLDPEIGGFYDAIDVLGVNYYAHNQWRIRGGFVPLGHHDYRPLSHLLLEIYERYRKPILIAETGAEYSARPAWIYYVCQEVRTAIGMGVPVVGITIYPITDYKGWDNDRLCEVGLFSSPSHDGDRALCLPFWRELERQEASFHAETLI